MARIDAVLEPKEARTDFIHSAVEHELEKREAGVPKRQRAALGELASKEEQES